MLEIVNFVSSSIVGGVAGNLAYDELKIILGSFFHKLSSYLHNEEHSKFQSELEVLLDKNKELKQQIIALHQAKNTNITINGDIKGVGVAPKDSIVNQIIS